MMRRGGVIGTLVVVWLLIGVFAAWQRGYFSDGQTSCASAGNIALATVVGPLNYAASTRRSRTVICPNPVRCM